MRLLALLAFLTLLAGPARADFAEAAALNARSGGVSMLVMRDGAVVFEDYPNGGTANAAHDLASGTKSFSGVVAAVAVKDGLLSLDEKAADTLTEWKSVPGKRDVTIRQILNLTAGVRPTPVGRAPTYAAAIGEPMAARPGERFDYGPLNFQIFGEIMRRKLAKVEGGRYADAAAYLEARVLGPIGVAVGGWKRGEDGYVVLPNGSRFTARDWAQFGEFVRQGGRHLGKPLVDEKAFAAMFEGSAVNAAYGLGWWLNKTPKPETLSRSRTMRQATDLYEHPRRGELPSDLVMAAGAGGQRLYLIPSKNLVVVRQHPKLFETRFARRRAGTIEYSDVEFVLALLD